MKVKIVPTSSYVLFRKVGSEESWLKKSDIFLNTTAQEEEYEMPVHEKSGGDDREEHKVSVEKAGKLRITTMPRILVEAEVVSTGPGEVDRDGKLHEPKIKTGDRVLLSRWVKPTREIIIDGQKHGITDSYGVIAILEKGE